MPMTQHMENLSGILAVGEVAAGTLSPISLELLGMGRKLAEARGEQLSMVLIDRQAEACAQQAIAHGADRVYLIQDAPVDEYEGASCTAILEKCCRETAKPAVMLFGQTVTGRDLAPRVAFRLKAGLVTDCVQLEIDPDTKSLIATKPVSGGNVLATYSLQQGTTQMISVRHRALDAPEPDDSRQGEVINLPAGVDASSVKAKVIEKVLEETAEGPVLETAEVVVSGGRGFDDAEEFDKYITHGLAEVLGAAVGATRGAVDGGLQPEQHQIGLTGKIVGPNLYIAVGISGAIQHMAGCTGAKHIVAINIDENAQIFRFAKYGIVGSYKEVLPPLIEKLKEMQAS
jgi:electron transfer flavoprotein alpha subunit